MSMVINGSQGIYFPDGTNQNTAAFATGTAIVFAQTTAPLGWTKSTVNDNAALRVVSGAVGSGGTVPFTTAFASQTPTGTVATSITSINGNVSISGTVGSTTLTTSQMPSHNHGCNMSTTPYPGGPSGSAYFGDNPGTNPGYRDVVNFEGGGSGHAHGFAGTGTFAFASGAASSNFTGSPINLAVKYVDTIIAIKD